MRRNETEHTRTREEAHRLNTYSAASSSSSCDAPPVPPPAALRAAAASAAAASAASPPTRRSPSRHAPPRDRTSAAAAHGAAARSHSVAASWPRMASQCERNEAVDGETCAAASRTTAGAPPPPRSAPGSNAAAAAAHSGRLKQRAHSSDGAAMGGSTPAFARPAANADATPLRRARMDAASDGVGDTTKVAPPSAPRRLEDE